ALEAYVRWGGDDALPLCLKFLESENPEEREAALKLLPEWKNPDVAGALALRIGRPGGNESSLAIEGVKKIGGPLAGQAPIRRREPRAKTPGVWVPARRAKGGCGGGGARRAPPQRPFTPPLDSQAIRDPITRDRAGRAAAIIAARQLGRLAADRDPRSYPDL